MRNIILIALMALLLAAPAAADTVVILNPDDLATAEGTIYFHDSGGNQRFAQEFSAVPNGSVFVETSGIQDLGPGDYSVIVDSSNPVGSVAVLGGREGNAPPLSAYNGFPGGESTVYVPLVHSQGPGGFNSNFHVQNLSGAGNAFTARFYHPDFSRAGGPLSGPLPVDGFAVVDPADAGAPQGFVGVASVSANGPVAVVNQSTSGDSALAFAGLPASQPGGDVFFPRVIDPACGGGSQLVIKNIAASGTVMVTYYAPDGTPVHTAEGSLDSALQVAFDTPPGIFPGCEGGAHAQAPGPIAGVAVLNSGGGRSAYNGPGQGGTSVEVAGLDNLTEGRSSKVAVQNTSGETANVQYVFYDSQTGKGLATGDLTLAPQGTEVVDLDSILGDARAKAAAHLSSNQPVAAVGIGRNTNTGAEDTANAGVNTDSLGTRSYLPVVTKN